MKKHKGFTLIELLAVIVILAIIALIAVPVILNIIEKARKSAFKDTAYGIVNSAELYYAEQQLNPNGISEIETLDLSSQVNIDNGLQIKGEVSNGTVKITSEGKIGLAIQNGRYCVTKGFDDTEVLLRDGIDGCLVPQTLSALSTEEVECATDKTEGACDAGTLFTLKVNNTDTKNFYVMKDEGEKVTLIMSENLGDTVAWYTASRTNNYGPMRALDYLDGLTDNEWNNIPKQDYTYSGIGEDGTTRVYEDITRTMRARIITYSEAISNTIGCTVFGGSCQEWATNGTSYWTSTAHTSDSLLAWSVSNNRSISNYGIGYGLENGVRPVIEIYK